VPGNETRSVSGRQGCHTHGHHERNAAVPAAGPAASRRCERGTTRPPRCHTLFRSAVAPPGGGERTSSHPGGGPLLGHHQRAGQDQLMAGIINVSFVFERPRHPRTDQRGGTLAGALHHGVWQRRGGAFALFAVAVLCHALQDVEG
jgi:hypothetical protein